MGLGLAVPINSTTRWIIAALMRDGRVRRAYLGLVTSPAPLPPWARERFGQPRRAAGDGGGAGLARRRRRGCGRGTWCSPRRRRPVADAQALQRLMFADAIGRPLPITVLRNGALVDVIAEPVELGSLPV